MLLAIVSDAAATQNLLKSLSEADFNLVDVSVIMQDDSVRNKIARDAGPLQGVGPAGLLDALQEAGASRTDAKRCADAVVGGKVLVAVKVVPKNRQAAREMLADHSAEIMSA